MGVLDDLLGDLDVLLEGQAALVDHDRGEAAVDTTLAQLEAVAVVQVDDDGQVEAGGLLGVFDGSLDQVHQIDVLGIGASALGNLQDQRRALFDGGLGDALDDLHVVHVESADGVAAIVSLLEHLGGSNKSHV